MKYQTQVAAIYVIKKGIYALVHNKGSTDRFLQADVCVSTEHLLTTLLTTVAKLISCKLIYPLTNIFLWISVIYTTEQNF